MGTACDLVIFIQACKIPVDKLACAIYTTIINLQDYYRLAVMSHACVVAVTIA